MQLDAARRQHGPSHPKVKELESQLTIAEIAAAGIPTEPVYKGKPLRHWEAILKYETLRQDRITASNAVIELLDDLPIERQVELLLLSYSADTWESQKWLRAKFHSTQLPFANNLLTGITLNDTTKGLILQNLNTSDTCETTVLMLATARTHLKNDPQWKPIIDAAYAQRKHLTEETQVYLAEMLPTEKAIKYVSTFEAKLGKEALLILTKAAMQEAIPLSRTTLMYLAGRCFTQRISDPTIAALFPSGTADSWTEQHARDAAAYFKPIVASYQSLPSSTITSSELEWLHQRAEFQQVPNELKDEVTQIFIDSIDRNRRSNPPSRHFVLRAARAVVLQTGKLPPNLRISDNQTLPSQIDRMLSANRNDNFDHNILASYPIEALARMGRMSKAQLTLVFYQNDVESAVARLELPPAVALAIVADESIPHAARKATSRWLSEVAGVGASAAMTELHRDVRNHEKLRLSLLEWFDRDHSRESEMVLSSVGPHPQLQRHLLAKLKTPPSKRDYELMTGVLGRWSEQFDAAELTKAIQIAGRASWEYFPHNRLLDSRSPDQAIQFLHHLQEFHTECERRIRNAEPNSEEYKATPFYFEEMALSALIIVDRAERDDAIRRLAKQISSQVQSGKYPLISDAQPKSSFGTQPKVSGKLRILDLLENIETGDPPQPKEW
jgi:hypothetical protein